MRHKSRPALRSSLSVMLLAIIALQMAAGMAFAAVCFEPCPDDTDEASCPPTCAACMSCTHAQVGIVRHAVSGSPRLTAQQVLPNRSSLLSSQLADDIFHVPLSG